VSEPRIRRARAVLVTDPLADHRLVDFARQIIGYGGTRIKRQQARGLLRAQIAAERTDLVIVLRWHSEPSGEVLTAAALAREQRKPVHALVALGVELGLEVDEAHVIDANPSWERRHDLQEWSARLPGRFGNR
jgi:hypothetical protein